MVLVSEWLLLFDRMVGFRLSAFGLDGIETLLCYIF